MRLSEAIRLGAMIHPQGFGSRYERDAFSNRIIASCAMGAAYVAVGRTHCPANWMPYYEIYLGRCPGDECSKIWMRGDCFLIGLVTHLNDVHRWTRERIADFVALHESQEPQIVVEQEQGELTTCV